ncbi:hypothetical protein LMG27952_02687 [Paraburkholderia hiiakae]|uniref:Uncharacterized protein n=1 Tax=Paraburkholderia hiiakae TaxID=1081782 RepID=A0ABN7HSR5_9BURK|nr:hypothetical protein [Paraburkholderia hiiakae]CAD6533009.1 hypothetical protein LMG27952_02687 [Paraburkholderia hiiakae]
MATVTTAVAAAFIVEARGVLFAPDIVDAMHRGTPAATEPQRIA